MSPSIPCPRSTDTSELTPSAGWWAGRKGTTTKRTWTARGSRTGRDPISGNPGAHQQPAQVRRVVEVAQLVLVLQRAVGEPGARAAAARAVGDELAARALLDLVGL